MNPIRLIVDVLRERIEHWRWSKGHLAKQKRSDAAQWASMGRFRESSTLTVDDDQRWDRYLRDDPDAWIRQARHAQAESAEDQKARFQREVPLMRNASRYITENCCSHFQALQEPCPYHPTTIMDERGFSSGAAIVPRKGAK